MNNAVTTTTNDPYAGFRARVAEKIKDDIGDLMSDEMLQSIVEATFESELKRPVAGHSNTPWIQNLIAKEIGDTVREEAKRQIEARKDEIRDQMSEAIKEQMPQLLATLLVEIMRGQSFAIQNIVHNMMNDTRSY